MAISKVKVYVERQVWQKQHCNSNMTHNTTHVLVGSMSEALGVRGLCRVGLQDSRPSLFLRYVLVFHTVKVVTIIF